MVITTTPYVEGQRIAEYLGLVTGVASFKYASTDEMWQELIRKARDQAVASLLEEAADKGASAIVGVRMDLEPEDGWSGAVVLTGTAVGLEKQI